jgi:hypothetical protein
MATRQFQCSRYSPGNLEPAILRKLFVGSEEMLRRVVQSISLSATQQEKYFTLLVGERGAGKTHFLWLVLDALQSDEHKEAWTKLKVAFLPEEEGVTSFFDFLLRVLQSLARRYPNAGLQEKLEGIYQAHSKRPEHSLQLIKEALISFVGDSTLLFICENAADLFEGLGEEGQQGWLAFLKEHPFWTIVATTPALFDGLPPPKMPFSGFFSIQELPRLDAETAIELLRRKAEIDDKPGLAAFLVTPEGRARAKAAYHLMGGSHRLYMVLSDFLSKESLDDLHRALTEMIDALTPYYQGGVQQLAPLQQKIILCLCQEDRPINIKRVSERCLISQQSAAKQIGALSSMGFVQKSPAGRESYCEIRDPLLRVCFELRANRTEAFRLLIEFLRAWFGAREMPDRAKLVGRLLEQRGERLHLEIALLFSRVGAARDAEFADLFASMLIEESALRGPEAAVTLAKDLRKILEENQRQALSCATLIRLSRLLVFVDALNLQVWERAFPGLQEAYSDLNACEIPLQFMRATLTYLLSQDKAALLALPLEQRSLLLEVLSERAEQ